MQKIVIDTNVIVAALIGSSFPRQILYYLVFEKYPEFVTKAEIVLNKLYELSVKYIPSVKITAIKDDPDNRVLELAFTAQADFIITGNTKDFTFNQYEGISVVTPEQFINTFLNPNQ